MIEQVCFDFMTESRVGNDSTNEEMESRGVWLEVFG